MTTAGEADNRPGDGDRAEKPSVRDPRANDAKRDISVEELRGLPPTERLEVISQRVLKVPDPRNPGRFKIVKDHRAAEIIANQLWPKKPDQVQPAVVTVETAAAAAEDQPTVVSDETAAAAAEEIRRGASYLETAAGLGVPPARLGEAVLNGMREGRIGEGGEQVPPSYRYPLAFRNEVVEAARKEPPFRIAHRYGLGDRTVGKWLRKARAAEE